MTTNHELLAALHMVIARLSSTTGPTTTAEWEAVRAALAQGERYAEKRRKTCKENEVPPAPAPTPAEELPRAPALTVCPNCQQWQRPPYGDCLNECARRGFAPYGKAAL